MTTTLARIQERVDTAANWASVNPTLLAGEQGIESDTSRWKLGDGITIWTSLPYQPSPTDLAGKVNTAALAPVAFTGSKADVGLGNVDNTPDAGKPLSTAAVTALAGKADLGSDGKVPASQLPAGSSGSGAVASVAGRTGDVILAKGDVGLGNVDNTADLSKPVSTATQTALNGKATVAQFNALAPVARSGAYADLSGTPSYAPVALSGAYGDLIGRPSVGVEDYRTIGGVIQTDSQAITAAITALPASGGTVRFGAGLTYTPSTAISNSGKSVRFLGEATKIVSSSGVIFNLAGTWGTTYTGTLSTTTAAAQFSGTTTVFPVFTSTSGSPGYARGDLVKVFSDDRIPEGRPAVGGNVSRLGEFARVYSCSGSTVTLNGPLRDTYSTNVRIARMNPITCGIEGVTLDVTDAMLASSTSQIVQLTSLYTPVVRGVRILRGPAQGVNLRSCFAPHITEYVAEYLTDNTATANDGYAVADNQCEGLYWDASASGNVRHAYTDNSPQIAAGNTDPAQYGRSRGATVIGLTSLGGSTTPIGPHHDGEGHTFAFCTISTPTADGIGLRGRYHTVFGCRIVNPAGNAFSIISEGVGGESYGHRFIDVDITGVPAGVSAFNLANHETNGGDPLFGTRTGKRIATINGGRIDGGDYLLQATNVTVDVVNNPTWTVAAAATVGQAGITLTNSVVNVESLIVDHKNNTAGSNLPLVSAADATSKFNADRVTIRTTNPNSDFASRVGFTLFTGTSTPMVLNDIVFDGAAPAQSTLLLTSGTTTTSPQRWRSLDGSLSSAGMSVTNTGFSTANLAGVARIIDNVITVKVTSTDSTNRSATLPSTGNHPGQTLILSFAVTGTVTLSLTNPSPSAVYAVTQTQTIGLLWDGTAWRLLFRTTPTTGTTTL